jgi:(E)-4-hydroxy-3-methylbut-2-enyl-diphosphate synthase
MWASPAAARVGHGLSGGKQSHKMDNDQMIDHIVEQVEKKAAEIEAGEGGL